MLFIEKVNPWNKVKGEKLERWLKVFYNVLFFLSHPQAHLQSLALLALRGGDAKATKKRRKEVLFYRLLGGGECEMNGFTNTETKKWERARKKWNKGRKDVKFI